MNTRFSLPISSMRLFFHLCKKHARLPQDPNTVPFKAMLPMRLNNYVSGKSDRQAEVPCLQELTILLASLKTNEFDESLCKKEIEILRQTNLDHLQKKKTIKEAAQKGILATGRNLTFRQLNKFMRNYPNPS